MILLGARDSPLSRAQVAEFATLYPHIQFNTLYIHTTGDLDQTTSLRTLPNSDFFTRELDQLLLANAIRLALHSAKDLPHPLPTGLALAALTPTLDPRDSLVLRPPYTLQTLPPHATIATSSHRREQVLRALRPDLHFIDLRGAIHTRLAQLNHIHGVVIAECALIRLQLTHLHRQILPGPTTPRQGQLAIVVREDDHEIIELCRS